MEILDKINDSNGGFIIPKQIKKIIKKAIKKKHIIRKKSIFGDYFKYQKKGR
jgi:hypothetical protein